MKTKMDFEQLYQVAHHTRARPAMLRDPGRTQRAVGLALVVAPSKMVDRQRQSPGKRKKGTGIERALRGR
jgi:hypothetical protein